VLIRQFVLPVITLLHNVIAIVSLHAISNKGTASIHAVRNETNSHKQNNYHVVFFSKRFLVVCKLAS